MFITALGTAVPTKQYRKSECLEAFARSSWSKRLSIKSRALVTAVLSQDNGIDTRHLALDSLQDVFQIDANTLHARFLKNAPMLASNAAAKALQQADLNSSQIDGLVVSTCTGYLCPGLSSYVSEQLGLPNHVQTFDLVGHGCAAAMPNLNLCKTLLASDQCEHVLSVCVEVCSAAMYLDEDPGVLISACLFGDGAGAAVLSRQANHRTRRIQWKDQAGLTLSTHRKALQFEHRDGMLRNVLGKEVPQLAANYAHQVMQKVLSRSQLDACDVKNWIMHAGGRDVLSSIQKKFDLDPQHLHYSTITLKSYGNLSSAFLYFVLEAALQDSATGGHWWLSSFGAGFSCYGALLEVET